MKAFVTYLKKESPAMQRPSGSTGWIELPNGQRWNPGHTYKFNAHESVRMKGGGFYVSCLQKFVAWLGV